MKKWKAEKKYINQRSDLGAFDKKSYFKMCLV